MAEQYEQPFSYPTSVSGQPPNPGVTSISDGAKDGGNQVDTVIESLKP